MPDLIKQIGNIAKRVDALETKDLDGRETIARITKLYGKVRVTATITASVHQYNICSESLLCSELLII